MGQCYGKSVAGENGGVPTTIVAPADSGDVAQPQSPLPSSEVVNNSNNLPSVRNTPARSSPWPSPYPAGVAPSPARSTPRRFFRRPFPPPSPAKHIKASLAKRLGNGIAKQPKEGPIPEDGGNEGGGQHLDKSFGYGKNLGAKYELGKEIGRGHFGHTCSAKGKKGELKDQVVAVKIISKAKVYIVLSLCKLLVDE